MKQYTIKHVSGYSIVTDVRTLKTLNNAGLIVWPKDVDSKGYKFRYVDEVDGVGMSFEHNGKKYRLKYRSGCFYPYVYEVFGQ